jgi:hypothetical protein
MVGMFGSLLVHLLVFAALRWAGTMPEMDFDLELPSEVEFGVSDAPEVEEPLAVPPEPAKAPEPVAAAADAPARDRRKPDTDGPDAGVADAGSTPESAQTSDAGVPGQGDRPLLAAFAPEGAQIALRVHLGRVRGSELAPDVRGLLEAIADWRLILDGSGLDPLQDLERLYIASPDLRRAHLVMAGQYVGGVEVAQRAVAAMAAARGLEARWRTHGGIRVAPWHNLDETERILALIAPQQFAITRTEDLQRVLQVARALARRKAKNERPEVDPGEALLALDQDETLALAVEGARLFARGNLRGIPERLEASVRAGQGEFDVLATGHFESEKAAERAAAYWQRERDRFAANPLVALIGLREPLVDAEIDAEGTSITARTRVSVQQARLVLGFIRDTLAPPRPAPAPSDALPPNPNIPVPASPPPIPGGMRRSEPTAPLPATPSSRPGP